MSALRLLTVLVALAFCLPAVAAGPESVEGEFAAQLEQARGKESTRALAATYAVQALSPFLKRPNFAQRVEDAAKSAANPLAAFELARIASSARLDLGKIENRGYNGHLAAQGCLREWSIIGPFANESMEGFGTVLPPELGESGPFPGKTVEVSWRDLPSIDQGCVFHLGQVVEPSSAALVYLSGVIEAPRSTRGVLLLGANGAYKVWLNGTLIGERTEDTGLSPDTDAWRVSLASGKNTLVIKLASESSRGLGVVARLTDTNLKPLTLKMQAQPNQASLTTGTVQADARGLLTTTQRFLEKAKGDDAIWGAWLLKRIAWRDTASPWRDVAEREIGAAGVSPRIMALASTLFDEAWLSQNTLERAAKAAPDDPFVQSQLAQLYEDSISEVQRSAAREILEKTLKATPDFLPARGQLVDWYRSRGLYLKAQQVLDKTSPDPEIPALLFRKISLAQELQPSHEVSAMRQSGLKIGRVSSSYLWDYIRELSVVGHHDEALVEIRAYRSVFPASVFAAKREAELLRATGDLGSALRIWNEMVAMAPGDAQVLEHRAEIHMAMGNRELATGDIENALNRKPQDQALREKLSFLRPAEDRFWETFLVTDILERAEKLAPTPFSYDTLVSQKITFVAPNGLSQQVTQRVDRALTAEGVEAAQQMQVAFSMGDERVDVLRVRVWKADGSVSEDFNQWESGGTRKGSTTYNDTAYVNVRANNVNVGDVVEFQYRVSQVANSNFRGDYFGDIAYLQSDRPIAFQRYAVIYPQAWELFFRPPTLKHTRADSQEGELKTTAFVMEGVPHVISDSDQPGATDVYDYLLASNKQTWDDIGVWWWQLIEEQLIVDEEIRRRVRELVKGKRTVEEKVEAIHHYVVRNTRYLHVGLGIHGWKPYRTTTAFRNRYGDCKDKAALLKVMLEEAGIEANMVLVRTRRLGSVDDFPASMHVFNHAITYVPALDLYLDGTAEFNGTRELTTMDQGAQALIVRDGGKSSFVRLPIDASSNNVLQMTLEVDLTGEEARTVGTIRATGANAVYFRSLFEDPERRKEEFERYLASTFPGVTIHSANFKNLSDLESPTLIDFEVRGGRFLHADGERRFIFPMGARKDLLGAYAKQATRSQPLDIRVPFTTSTTVRYKVAPDQNFSKPPADFAKKSQFGGVSVTYEQKPDGSLEAKVEYHIDVQRVALEDYSEFRSFMSSINDALNNTIAIGETP